MRPRLLPILIAAAVLLLGVKLAALTTGGDAEAIATAWAQATTPAPAKQETAAAEPAAMQPKMAPSKPAPPPATKTPAQPQAAAPPVPRDPLLMSPAEIDELQQLSQRREELERRNGELRERQVLMEAAEKRMDEKIVRLQTLQQTIDGAALKQDEEEDARVKSLVRIYETMKPADAARIFEQLDMPVLLNVISHMRELKTAPILAAMDPAKARSITLAMAEHHKTDDAKMPQPAPPR